MLAVALLPPACGASSDSAAPEGGSASDAGSVDASGSADAGGPGGEATKDGGSCPAGFDDCDGSGANGCETNLGADDGHCGRCGVACTSGQSCQSGACVAGPVSVMPAGLVLANGACLAVDATHVYVTAGTFSGGGKIYRAPKAGGAPVVIGTDASPQAIAVDATSVYWGNASGTIVRAGLDGASPHTIYPGTSGVKAMVLDPLGVLFTTHAGFLARVDKDGSDPRQLYPVVGALGNEQAEGLAISGGFAFFASPYLESGSLFKVSTTGTDGGVAIATGLFGPFFVTADASTVYLTNGTDLVSVPTSATSPAAPSPVATGDDGPLTTDGHAVYWAKLGSSGNTGAIMKRGSDGVAVTLAPMVAPGGLCLAFDASSLFWIDFKRGVLRAAK